MTSSDTPKVVFSNSCNLPIVNCVKFCQNSSVQKLYPVEWIWRGNGLSSPYFLFLLFKNLPIFGIYFYFGVLKNVFIICTVVLKTITL